MKTMLGRYVGLAALSFAASAAATPVLIASDTNPVTGHFYEVYAAEGISWSDAHCFAAGPESGVEGCDDEPGLAFEGVKGHLVTITSEAEDVFVDALRAGEVGDGLQESQVWIGGFRDGTSPTGWRWVDEGNDLSVPGQPFPGTNTGPAYTNWASGEPNNSGGNENGVTLGRYDPARSWNDEGAAPGSIGGFIVEYDVPLEGGDCSVEAGGCQTIQGQTLQFPAGSIPQGARIGFIPFEFTDPRVALGTCGSDPLVLFGNDGVPDNELVIPPYLCGSPKFIAVRVDAEELEIAEGVVLVENFTESVLPGNQYPDGTKFSDPLLDGSPSRALCQDPIPAGVDPQYQDVVVWQTTDPSEMREDGSSVDAQFVGKAGEFTDSCGSSRGKTLGASYFVVGMRIDFGAGNELDVNPDANHERFIALTRYKLALLQESVEDAKADGAIKNGDATKMGAQLKNAVKKLDTGNPAGALGHVRKFLKFADAANYTEVPGKNYNGEHLSRGSNVEFMLRVKVIPYE